MKLLIEIVEPISMRPNTDKEDPNRAMLRSDNEDPR
jgi:hypothetical protein